uniref:Uncharacterized protein n=1 Tax=Panagrellus redivivus TaxID=6233 RepID=A0A7E4ZTD2_PANRE
MLTTKLLFLALFAVCCLAMIVEARILLSCRIIDSICQDESNCLKEMKAKFDDCYEGEYSDLIMTKRGAEDEKRANAFKLMNLLVKVDRIPVGR